MAALSHTDYPLFARALLPGQPPKLVVKLTQPRQLLGIHFDHEPCGGIFVASPPDLTIGTLVDLEIDFMNDIFRLRGRVVWRRLRHGQRKGLEEGVGVAFLPQQAEAVRRLMMYVSDTRERGALQASGRESRRIPIEIKIKYDSYFTVARDFAADLSLGGMRVLSDTPPLVGEPVVLYLRPPGAIRPMRLTGEVAWRRAEGERCFGVRFTNLPEKTQKRLDQLVTQARLHSLHFGGKHTRLKPDAGKH